MNNGENLLAQPFLGHQSDQEEPSVKDNHAKQNQKANPLVDVHDLIIVQDVVTINKFIGILWRLPDIASSFKLIAHKSSESICVE